MKKILFALSAVALLFATSCKKESVNPAIDVPEGSFLATIDNGANPQNAPRINDGMGTMTVIDNNRYVLWESGDQISINGSNYTTSTAGNSVVFSGGNATGTTFHAFYPALIAITDNRGALAPTQIIECDVQNNIKVSNLPMYATSTDNQLTFHNICAAIKITIPSFLDGATSIVVSSNERMNGTFTVVGDSAKMETAPSTDADKKVTISKASGTFATGEDIYIAVPAQAYTDFKIEFFNNTTSMWNKTLTSCTFRVNKVYNVNITPMHEYVDLGLSVKWATCNVGATAPQEYGDYFAWGETEPYYSSLNPLTWKTGKTDGYAWASYPYHNGTAEVGTQPYDATTKILKTQNDVAIVNWGGNWRMPTITEWNELLNNCTWTLHSDYNSTGVAGYEVTSNKDGYTDKSIFLPCADFFDGSSLKGNGYGQYWSATRSDSNDKSARAFTITNFSYAKSVMNRYFGCNVRPVCP